MKLLTLDEVLQRSHQAGIDISLRTFRYYGVLGLIPEPSRLPNSPDGRVKYYPVDVVERLRHIRDWQTEGYSLKQIKQLVGQLDNGAVARNSEPPSLTPELPTLPKSERSSRMDSVPAPSDEQFESWSIQLQSLQTVPGSLENLAAGWLSSLLRQYQAGEQTAGEFLDRLEALEAFLVHCQTAI